MITRKNYYVCLTFRKRPNLHMTLRYFPDLTPDVMSKLVTTIDEILAEFDLKRFRAEFEIEARYGPYHTVRVLEPKSTQPWPGWLMVLLAKMPTGSKKYKWHPHVATKKAIRLDTQVVAVSLMCKKVEIARWDLI